MKVPWRGTLRPPAALDDRRCQDAWGRRRISHTGGFDQENSTIMHDYARLDTISSFASSFADATEDRKATEDRGELAGRVHGDLAIFCRCLPFRHKKVIFSTFIGLYPPLSTFIGMVWHRRTCGAGARPDGRDCATLAQDPLRGGGRNAVRAVADVCRPQPHAAFKGIT